MEDLERVRLLTPEQREVLELYDQGYHVSEIATKIGKSVSTVNQRLRGAREALGVGSSQVAARMVRQFDQSQGVWIPPTGSESAFEQRSVSPPDGPASTAEGQLGDLLADSGFRGDASPYAPASGLIIKLPFPTVGRPTNDLTAFSRMGWALALAVLVVALLMILAALSVGLQDILAGLQHTIVRLF
jgi:DNA-binding CsgD family transcriptional regulator